MMKSTYSRTMDGVDITVERKRIKNMYLRVHPDGQVLLTAPMHMPDAAIERFARERLPWLLKKRQAMQPPSELRYETGDTVSLFGTPCRLSIVFAGKRARVERIDNTILLTVPPESTPESRKRALDAWLRQTLAQAINAEIPSCEHTVGKHASAWRIRDMKSRWGSCNTATGAITINLQLASREPIYLRYVMLHELTHLHEPSHNARFYAFMDRFCPDWHRIRKTLKQGG